MRRTPERWAAGFPTLFSALNDGRSPRKGRCATELTIRVIDANRAGTPTANAARPAVLSASLRHGARHSLDRGHQRPSQHDLDDQVHQAALPVSATIAPGPADAGPSNGRKKPRRSAGPTAIVLVKLSYRSGRATRARPGIRSPSWPTDQPG